MVGLIQNNTVEIIIGYLLVAGLFVAYHMRKAPEVDENGNIIMRASFEGNTGMTMISEVKAVYDLLPEDF